VSSCQTNGLIDHIRLDGLTVTNNHDPMSCLLLGGEAGFAPNFGDYSEIVNSTFHDCGKTFYDHGIYLTASHVTIRNNLIYNISGYGVHVYSPKLAPSDNIIDGNTIHNTGTTSDGGLAFAIVLSYGNRNVAMNNVIYNNQNGISIFDWGTTNNSQVVNNTIYNNGQAPPSVPCGSNCNPAISVSSTSTGAIVRNNILWANRINSVSDRGESSVLSNQLTVDPLFVNAAGNDFHLTAGSPAKDAGVALDNVLTDLDGTRRPVNGVIDVGAFEYSDGSGSVAPPTNVRLVK
jgi:hypothetical protein